MTFYANNVHPVPPDRCATDCDDQLPLISRVGRGVKGDAWQVKIAENDECTETKLIGGYYDEASHEWHSEWISDNINGGELKYQYNLRPYTIPRTFTITFIYQRPGRHEWSWTTPAIPYIWTVDNEDGTQENPDSIVGTGVATLFVKTMHSDWKEKLVYPIDPDTGESYAREDFNAPKQGEAWTSNVVFGIGGDIDVPDLDDIAKIIGVTPDQIKQIIKGNTISIGSISNVANLKDYIDKCDKRDLDHLHKDLGFNTTGHAATGAFGGKDTVKAYIDWAIANSSQESTINALTTQVNNLRASLGDVLSKIVGNNTINADGTINWDSSIPSTAKIPRGNMNVYGGDSNSTTEANGYILSHPNPSGNNDIWAD